MQRRQVLAGHKQLGEKGELVSADKEQLAFIDEDESENDAIEGEIKAGEEANLVKIVVQNLVSRYSQDATVLKKAKDMLKAGSEHIPDETFQSVKSALRKLKEADYAGYLAQLYPLNSQSSNSSDLSTLQKCFAKALLMQNGPAKGQVLGFLVTQLS